MRRIASAAGVRSFSKIGGVPYAQAFARVLFGGDDPGPWTLLAFGVALFLLAATLPGCGSQASVAPPIERFQQYEPVGDAPLAPVPGGSDEPSLLPVAYEANVPVMLAAEELNIGLGPEPIEPAQSIVALEKETGRIAWRRQRDGDHAYSTPLVVEMDGVAQIVSVSGRGVASYDPDTGRELWWCRHHGHTVVPRPVFGHGMVYFCTGYEAPSLIAIDPTGEYDISESHVRWQAEKGVPFNASPLLIGTQLFLMGDRGVLTCYDAILGTLSWQHRLSGNFSSSPIEVDGLVLAVNDDGVASVIQPGDEFELIATNVIDAPVQASPAVSGKSLFLRTESHLYRIAATTDDGDAPLDWPQFRGPTGDGNAGRRDMQLRWSESRNVVWKTAIAGRGWSSPVIAGDQVWLTTALEESDGAVSLRAVCINRTTGETQHDIEILRKQSPEPMHPRNSHATPTPVIDGDRVYIHFGAHATACVSTDGRLLWRTRIPYHHYHGPAGSPIVCGNLVVINCDGYDGPYDRESDQRVNHADSLSDDRTTDE